MNEKLRQMERVRYVREMRERLREASVARATARMREAEERVEMLERAELAAAREAVLAIDDGERREWVLSLAVREALGVDRERCRMQWNECGEGLEAARKLLLDSRIETEQAKVLCDEVRGVLLKEEDRRAHAESVDRFSARRYFRSERLRVRELMELG